MVPLVFLVHLSLSCGVRFDKRSLVDSVSAQPWSTINKHVGSGPPPVCVCIYIYEYMMEYGLARICTNGSIFHVHVLFEGS